MKVYCIGHGCAYEAENLARLFYRDVEVIISDTEPAAGEERIVTYLQNENGKYIARCDAYTDNSLFTAKADESTDSETAERVLGKAMYKALTKATGVYPPWGILTGVRPVKLTRSLGDKAYDFLVNKSLVSVEKALLAISAAENESRLTALSGPDSFSLYIGIPFCPSRCSYCSFVSKTVENASSLIEKYVDLLVKEIRFTAELSHKIGLKLQTVYFGGGTPTVLSALQLDRITSAVNSCFDISSLLEYTVEAGRPETIDAGKLDVLIKNGCRRLSVNPQTMEDNVLAAIGRNHSAEDVLKAFELVRRYPFDAVNMDIIAGLPSDTAAGFKSTVDAVCALSPENITVHALCLKRSSKISEEKTLLAASDDVQNMLAYAQQKLSSLGYSPYYVYRQRNTVSNAENTGYSIPGKECLYNVFTMDQTHTVLSCGAGGVTILRDPHGSYVERVFNFKYPYEYVSRFETLIDRKRSIAHFYEKYHI